MTDEFVYVLLADGARTLHSIPTPFNVVVRTEEEAKRWMKGKDPLFFGYIKTKVFDSYEKGQEWYSNK